MKKSQYVFFVWEMGVLYARFISPPLKRFILFHNKRHPSEMGTKEINQFLNHLAVKERVAASTQNQALCAILFLYRHVLKKETGELDLVWAKKPKRLPVVFTREEVKLVLGQLSGTKQLMAKLLYGTGLRHSELLRLRVKDIDFEYHQIIIRDGKGEQDRVTMLPECVKDELREHLKKLPIYWRAAMTFEPFKICLVIKTLEPP